MTGKEAMESDGFLAYMDDKFPRPRVFRHHDMCDTSPETIARRKARFYGHVDGIHPALLWHLKEYRRESGKPMP